jgi:hypothetical protein
MELIRLQDEKVTFAVGLDKWALLDPISSAHSQISAWRSDQYEFAATYKVDGGRVFGLITGGEYASKQQQAAGTRLLALAACVASLDELRGKSALVGFELDGDALVVVGLRNGLVVLDELVSTSAFDDARKRFEQKVHGDFGIWGDGAHLPRGSSPLPLARAVPKRGGPMFKPLRSTRPLAVLGVASALIIAIVATWLVVEKTEQARRRLSAEQLLVRNSPKAKYQESSRQLLEKPVVPLAPAIEAFRVALKLEPTVHAGWDLKGARCAPEGTCTLHYMRIRRTGTTFADFEAARLPHWKGVAPVGEEDAMVTIDAPVPPAVKLQPATWPVADKFTRRNYNQWQYLEPGGWKASFGARTLQAIPAGMDTREAAGLAALPEAIFAVPLSVAAQAWWYCDDDPDSPISAALLGTNTVMDGELELSVQNKDVTFSVKGISYVR